MDIKLIRDANIMVALGVTDKRMKFATEEAQKLLVKRQRGSSLDMLEAIIEQTKTTAETIAFTLVWDSMVTRAEQMQQEIKENEKPKKSKIISLNN